MTDPPLKKQPSKKEWVLTPPAFQRLFGWLGGDGDSKGQVYLEMRERLVCYFDRKNCSDPDELAAETLNRVTRRLEEGGAIESETPRKYCYVIARFVFMEYLRERQKEALVLADSRRCPNSFSDSDEEKERKEMMLDCLDQCTGKLDAAQRELILSYYIGKERVKIENRRALAKSLGLTMNALSIRACRIRNKLEACVRQCVGAK